GCNPLHGLRRLLLLVPEILGPDVQRDARQAALLALLHRLPPDLRLHARPWDPRHAASHLHLRARARVGHVESAGDDRRGVPGARHVGVRRQSDLVLFQGGARGKRSLGCVDARVVHGIAAPGLQLRDTPGRPQPAAALGSQAPRGSRLEVRAMTNAVAVPVPEADVPGPLPHRGRVGMYGLIAAEAAIFTIFVVAYLFYVGK